MSITDVILPQFGKLTVSKSIQYEKEFSLTSTIQPASSMIWISDVPDVLNAGLNV